MFHWNCYCVKYLQADLKNLSCFVKQEVPPLPRRNRHLDGLNDQDRVLYAQLRKQSPREIHICQDHLPGDNPGRAERSTTQSQNISRCRPPSEPDSVYSELDLLDSKSRSLPLLNNNSSDREQYRLSAPPNTPPRLSPKPFRQATHYSPSPEKTDSCSRPSSTHSLEYMSDNAVYHLAGRPDSPHTTSFETRTSSEQSQSLYAEVTSEALVARFPQENTYELIPGLVDTAKLKPNRLEDMGPKHNHSSWGLKVSNVVKMLSLKYFSLQKLNLMFVLFI